MAKVGSQRGLKVLPFLRSSETVFDTYGTNVKIFMFHCLQNYIQEIRRCTTKDAEEERVQKELGKIRKKYTSDKSMSGMVRCLECVSIRGEISF
jgi:hypothetical protein